MTDYQDPKYQLLIDQCDGDQWITKHFRTYDSLEDAIKAWKYLAHHHGELGKLFSIREAGIAGVSA